MRAVVNEFGNCYHILEMVIIGMGKTAELTNENEIRNMGDFGIIVVDSLWDENRKYLLFEKDGVKIFWHTGRT